MSRIKTENIHIHLTDEPRGDHLTNRCLTADVRDNGFFVEGWRNEVEFDINFTPYDGIEVEMYQAPRSFEIDLILSKKPITNVFVYDIQTNGLNFYFQPELTEEELAAGCIRPENVINSYSVYHSAKSGNYKFKNGIEKNYKTGKAFHIFRPKAFDAIDAQVWCELQINKEKGELTVTVPQEFLDTATYPVTIDPNFGNDDLDGFSLASTSDPNIVCTRVVMDNTPGQKLDSMTVWLRDYLSEGPFDAWTAIYTNDSGNRLPLDVGEECSASTPLAQDYQGWVECSHSGTYVLSANGVYWLALSESIEHCYFQWESIGDNNYASDDDNSGGSFPDPWVDENHYSFRVAIYGTYSAVPETRTFNSNSTIYDVETETFNSDSIIHDVEIETFNSNSHIWNENTKTFNSNSHIWNENTETFNSDSIIHDVETETFNSNSHTYAEETGTFNSNSYIYIGTIFVSNSHIYGARIVTVTSDARIISDASIENEYKVPRKIQPNMRNTDITPQSGGNKRRGFRIF